MDYEVSVHYSQMEAASITKDISAQVESEIMTLLFPDPRIGFLPSWKQGFYFDKQL